MINVAFWVYDVEGGKAELESIRMHGSLEGDFVVIPSVGEVFAPDADAVSRDEYYAFGGLIRRSDFEKMKGVKDG